MSGAVLCKIYFAVAAATFEMFSCGSDEWVFFHEKVSCGRQLLFPEIYFGGW